MQKSIKEILEHILLPVSKLWGIEKAAVNDKQSEITIDLCYLSDKVNVDGISYPIYDFRTARNWRHLDLWQYKTYISSLALRY